MIRVRVSKSFFHLCPYVFLVLTVYPQLLLDNQIHVYNTLVLFLFRLPPRIFGCVYFLDDNTQLTFLS